MVRQLPLLYLRALRERPISTNIISGSIVMLCGDGIAQSIEYYRHHQHQHGHLTDQSHHNHNRSDTAAANATGKKASITSNSHDEVDKDVGGAATSDTVATTTISDTIRDFFKTQYDPYRAGVIMSWAAVGDVPINLALFSVIERTLKPMGIPARASLSQSMLKAVCFFVPGVIIRMPCFLIYMTSMEHVVHNVKIGRPLSTNYEECLQTIQHKLGKDLPTIMYNGARVWVPINTLFFYMVPTELRTIGISFVAVGWMTYLSLMQHKHEPLPSTAAAAAAAAPLKRRVVATSSSTER